MDRRGLLIAGLIWLTVVGYAGAVTVANWDLLFPGVLEHRFFGAPLLMALLMLIPLLYCWLLLRKLVFRPARVLSRDVRALLESPKTEGEITLPPSHALGDLPEVVGALTLALRTSRREIRSAMASATAQMDEQKTWLEVILQGLVEGVLVCNRNHQMLLFNQSAVALLGAPERVGLGRPLFQVLSRAPIEHTLERLEWRLAHGAPASELSAAFVCSNIDSTRMLQGRMSLIVDAQGGISAYLVTLVDISADVETISQVDAVRRALTVDLRGTLGNLRAAAETIQEHPSMPADTRARFDQVLREESEELSRHLEQLALFFRGHTLGRYPMSDIYSADLVNCVAQRLKDRRDLELVSVGQPLWIMGDSLSLMRALESLITDLAEFAGPQRFEVETLLGDRRVYMDISWKGVFVPQLVLDTWLDRSCGEELAGQTVRDVLQRHGIELWSQPRGQAGEALLRLPMIAPKRPQFVEAGEDLPPRPEFYDFGLMREHQGDSALAATPLGDLSFVVFDCEMTGLDPMGGDEIISIAGVRVVKGRVLTGETFERLINPGKPIPTASIRFHGITDDQVQGKPSITEVLPLFHNFVGDAIMVAHNAAFDMKFLSMKEKECGLRFDNPVLDTLLLSAMLEDEDEDHSLDALIQRYGIVIDGRHTALGDAIGTAHLLVRLVERLQSQGYKTFGEVMKRSNMAAQLRQRDRNIGAQATQSAAVGG